MKDALLRLDQVLKRIPVSRATLYRLIEKKEFPLPARLGSMSVWPESEVDAFVERTCSVRSKLGERNAS